MRFVSNCRARTRDRVTSPLTIQEIVKAENYWLSLSQNASEVEALTSNHALHTNTNDGTITDGACDT